MALSDLKVFTDYMYSAATETVAQQIQKFNAASNGTITLSVAPIVGDYSDAAMWKKISGLVRRRNPYGSGAVAEKSLEHIVDTMVKIAAGTPPVRIDPSMLTWIQRDPAEAGVVYSEQLAGDMMADMLNTAIMAAYAAMVQNTAMTYDATGDTPDTLSYLAMNKAVTKFGDRAQEISAWITHSLPYRNLMNANLQNGAQLFRYDTVVVMADPEGRAFIVTDSPALIDTTPNPDTYQLLGLTRGAVNVSQNNDYFSNVDMTNGDENIKATVQAEWSYNLAIKGYAWDKQNGGKAPTNAALATSTNWDKYVTSDKDGPGVLLKVDVTA